MRLQDSLFSEISQVPNTPVHFTANNVVESVASRSNWFEINTFLAPAFSSKKMQVCGCQEQLDRLTTLESSFAELAQQMFDRKFK